MVGFFEHQYLSYKKSHFRNLIALAKVDEKVKVEEINFLLKVGEKFGLKQRHLQIMMDDLKEYEPEVPISFIERMEQLFELVGLMWSDEFIDQRELQFIDVIRRKFKISASVVSEMIEMVKNNYKPAREDWFKLSRATGVDNGF